MNLADTLLPAGAGGRPPRNPGDQYTGIQYVPYDTGVQQALVADASTFATWISEQSGVYNLSNIQLNGPLEDDRYWISAELVSRESIGPGGEYYLGFLELDYSTLEGIEVMSMSELNALRINHPIVEV